MGRSLLPSSCTRCHASAQKRAVRRPLGAERLLSAEPYDARHRSCGTLASHGTHRRHRRPRQGRPAVGPHPLRARRPGDLGLPQSRSHRRRQPQPAPGTCRRPTSRQLDTDALADLLAGHDAVVFAAGAGGGNPARTYAVDRDAAIRVIDAAAQAGVKRFVMVSYFGAGPEHGVPRTIRSLPTPRPRPPRTPICAPAIWIGRCSGRAGSPSTRRPAASRIGAGGTVQVSRADVALVAAAALADDSTIGRTIEFNNGDVPSPKRSRADPVWRIRADETAE